MFQEINSTPWSDLTHAYGSAREVPMWLRQMAGRDEKVRKQAMNDLWGSICHQGWICPATAYTMPYLIALLQEPAVQGKEDILELLAEIALAYPELQEERWRKNLSIPQWNVPEHIPFKDARSEVRNGVPAYILLLEDLNPTVRMQAANVLAHSATLTPELQAHLHTSLQHEPELLVRAGEHGLLVFCAALALAGLAKDKMPQEVVPLFTTVLLQPPEELEAYLQLPCSLGASWRAAALGLSNLGPERLQFLVPALQEELPRADRWRQQTIAELLLFIGFPRDPQEEHNQWGRDKLTEQQRAVLFLICTQKQLLRRHQFTDLLAAYGLPDSSESMGAFLGCEIPSPYEGGKLVEVVRLRPRMRVGKKPLPSKASRILHLLILFLLFGVLVFIFLRALFFVLFIPHKYMSLPILKGIGRMHL